MEGRRLRPVTFERPNVPCRRYCGAVKGSSKAVADATENTRGLSPLEKKSLALESKSVFYRCQTIQSQTCLSASMVSTSDSARLLEKLVRKYPDCVAYTILPACGVCYLKTVASPVRAICNLKSQCNSTINDNHCPRSHGHCFQ